MKQRMLAMGSGGGITYQSGEFTDTINSGTFPTYDVTFNTPFSSVPKVYVRQKWADNDYGVTADRYMYANAINVSTTGFTISYNQAQTSRATISIEWIAFVD